MPRFECVATAMLSQDDPGNSWIQTNGIGALLPRVASMALPVLAFGVLASQPALAQSSGTAFCGTAMATTIKNIFTLIQFGGPLVGGVIALGATVALPVVRRAEFKLELKEARNQAIIWGVIVAPLGTVIIAFLLNNVVAGGSSCSF